MRIDRERPLAWPVQPVQTSSSLHVSGPAILIACSDRACAETIRESYEPNGHRILVANDVIAALDTVEAEPSVSIVIAELAPPHFDGLALVERMRQVVSRPIQFIIVGTSATADDVTRAMRLKVVDFVSDPQDGSQLHGALARALAVCQELAAQQAQSPAQSPVEALESACLQGLSLLTSLRQLGDASAPPTPADRATRTMELLRSVQRSRVSRDKLFPADLFEDSCWHMLVDLMINRLGGRRVSVSSLCIASGVAQTTALRRISDLNARGLVRRVPDERDGRRVFIELTDQGFSAISRYLDFIENGT